MRTRIRMLTLLIASILWTTTLAAVEEPAQIAKQVKVGSDKSMIMAVTLKSAFSSKNAKQGDVLTFELRRPFMVDRFTVIDKGTLVRARIRSVIPASHRGRPGRIDLESLETTAVDDTIIPLKFADLDPHLVGSDAKGEQWVEPSTGGTKEVAGRSSG